jgi:hypothetical protein
MVKEYKIGNCIKVKNVNYLTNYRIYVIIKIGKNSLGENIYTLDGTYGEKEFHHSYLYQDSDCFKMERKLKLEKLKKLI